PSRGRPRPRPRPRRRRRPGSLRSVWEGVIQTQRAACAGPGRGRSAGTREERRLRRPTPR
ncbi:hypothetical protein EMIHUDRAFT_371633, partial [Emiliania huxleyi CCMP1516]|uniref:Uncharacterized protein n=2 Tax=Emiliania huxleyi TaxID=2903 RepID=A0A0D3IHN5_EMIH1